MNRIIPFLVLLLLGSNATGQILTGTIFDKETKSPIPIAVVYFDGTSAATYTDEKGKFLLDSKSHSNLPLTVSALGYYSTVINEFSSTKDIIVYLEPKLFEIDDVTIKARGNSNIRKQNLAIFRREFLGRTNNARECEILNEDDIRFTTSKDKDTLRAYSLKPIFVINKPLGYKITYYLNRFEYIKSAYRNQLIGNSIFDEDTSSIDIESIRLRRDNTYYGSKMHFVRTLWHTDIKSPGYSIKNLKKQVQTSEIVRNRLSTTPGRPEKLIYYPGLLPVLLSVKWVPGKAESGMELLRNNITIEENGFYKGPGILWHGEMAKQGIADLLPYDYKPSQEFDPKFYSTFGTDTTSLNEISGQAELTEKAYLHTDRDIYSQGDDIWFKAYLVDGISHELSDSSGNLYVELISPDIKTIDHRVIKLQNGLGNGDFYISDTLKSGNYILRAYTRYMRNFGDQVFFYKSILITDGSDILIAADTLIKKQYKTEFQFFPESGSLIEYVPSVLAFKAIDQEGFGCDVTGELHSISGELITTFNSTHLGMGKINFRPEEGVYYYATVRYPGGTVMKKELPSIFKTGFVISAITNNLNQTLITLKTNSKTFATYQNRDILISISSHGKVLKVITARITSLNTSFVLPKEELPNGILMITMFTPDNKPLCERLVYIENGPDLVLNLETNQSSFQKRDSAIIKLSVNDFLGNDSVAFLSMSVSNDIYSHPFPLSISSWFLLESDIHGHVENPAYYFDPCEPDRLKNLDLLLLTHGWRDFEWKFKDEKLLTEKGFTISGKLRKTLLDIPIANQQVTLAIIQNNKNIITSTQTDSTGRFKFEIENMVGKAKILLSAVNKKGDFTGRFILDTINPKPHIIKKELFDFAIPKVNYGKSNIQQVNATYEFKQSINKKYTLSDTIMIGEVQITAKKKESVQENRLAQSREKYGHPDKEIIVTENLRNAGNIRELLTGRVAGIMFTKPSSSNDSGIRIRGVSSLLSQEPLFLLDGFAVSYSIISALPISFINRVDVIKAEKAAAFGINGANGIISVITKAGTDLNSTSETHSLSMIANGFNEPRIFYSKTHNLTRVTEYKPDLRSTLLWTPNLTITTNKDYLIKYFNGDIPSKYRIIVEGITSDGRPISGHFDYELLNK